MLHNPQIVYYKSVLLSGTQNAEPFTFFYFWYF